MIETGLAVKLKTLYEYATYFSHLMDSFKISALYLEAEQNEPDSTVIFY